MAATETVFASGDLWRDAADNWMDEGLCRANPDVFFAPEGNDMTEFHRRQKLAKAICGWCKVREQCLSYALEAGEEHGIWGGTSPAERKRMQEAS